MQAATALQPTQSYAPYSLPKRDQSPTILGGDAIVRTYGKRQDVFVQGDRKRSVYQVVSGMVCLYTILADGKRQIFDFALPGDIIGLGASETYTCCAQTIGEARLKCLPLSSIYERAAQNPMFGIALYKAISRELDATRDLLLTLGQLGALERVATFLLVLAKRSARIGNKLSDVLQLPMTRSDIADLLGLTIETISRSLTRLRQRNLIKITHNSEIRILDIEQLRDLAGLDQNGMAADAFGMDAVDWRH
jgi:CRP/FNR family transcriptional regulator